MVRQERDRRGPEPGGDQEKPGHLTDARARAARRLTEAESRARSTADRALVRPGHRERVEAQLRAQWREPVIVLRLDEKVDLGYAVPGRRLDGTVKGERLIRRSLWNAARAVGGTAAVIASLLTAGGAANPYKREIRVTGPENAHALPLLDALRPAKGPWLACSPSHLAVVDTGPTHLDPTDTPPPKTLWHTQGSQRPQLSFRTRTLTWPDGSTFTFPLHGQSETHHLRQYLEPPETIHWHGRPPA